MMEMAFDQPEVQPEMCHLFDNGRGVGYFQPHPGTGMCLQVITDDDRRQIVADGQGGTDGQWSDNMVVAQ